MANTEPEDGRNYRGFDMKIPLILLEAVMNQERSLTDMTKIFEINTLAKPLEFEQHLPR